MGDGGDWDRSCNLCIYRFMTSHFQAKFIFWFFWKWFCAFCVAAWYLFYKLSRNFFIADWLQDCDDTIPLFPGNELLLDIGWSALPPQFNICSFLFRQKVFMAVHDDWLGWVSNTSYRNSSVGVACSYVGTPRPLTTRADLSWTVVWVRVLFSQVFPCFSLFPGRLSERQQTLPGNIHRKSNTFTIEFNFCFTNPSSVEHCYLQRVRWSLNNRREISFEAHRSHHPQPCKNDRIERLHVSLWKREEMTCLRTEFMVSIDWYQRTRPERCPSFLDKYEYTWSSNTSMIRFKGISIFDPTANHKLFLTLGSTVSEKKL